MNIRLAHIFRTLIVFVLILFSTSHAQDGASEKIPSDPAVMRQMLEEEEDKYREADAAISALVIIRGEIENAIQNLERSAEKIPSLPESAAALVEAITAREPPNEEAVADLRMFIDGFGSYHRETTTGLNILFGLQRLLSRNDNSIIAASLINQPVKVEIRTLSAQLAAPTRELADASGVCSLPNVWRSHMLLAESDEEQGNTSGVFLGDRAFFQEQVTTCFESYNASNVKLMTNNLVEEAKRISSQLSDKIENYEDARGAARSRVIEIQRKLDSNHNISQTLLWVVPIMAVILVCLLAVPMVYQEGVQAEIFARGLILKVLTVFLLVASILILGLADKIPPEALGTLIGGISGYVLGSQLSSNRDSGHTPLLLQNKNPKDSKDADAPAPVTLE